MKRIDEIDVSYKKVILRCDFNVPIKDGKILSDERISSSLETINYLINNHAKIIIMSHLGKVKTLADKKNNSLYLVYERLSKLLNGNVYFSPYTKGKELENKINSLNYGDVLLMENTRFEDLNDKAESENSDELSKYWASLADIFVNDAFAMTHRKHASNYGISKYLPNAIGFLVDKEIKGLECIVNPKRPFTVIMGGAKVEDKLDYIIDILPKCDYLLVGGGIANSFLSVNYNVGLSLYNKEKKEELKRLLSIYKDKIIMPSDVVVLNNNIVTTKNIKDLCDDDSIYDIGDNTLSIYKDIIDKSMTIFLNGTAGKYEDNRFEKGTKSLLEFVSRANCNSVIGGGDAISSSEYFNVNNFSFISTGGGATLAYIASGKLASME